MKRDSEAGSISKKGFNVSKRKGTKNKMTKNRPKAKKMGSPYKTKQVSKKGGNKNKGQNVKILKGNPKGAPNDSTVDSSTEITPVKSILKKSKQENKDIQGSPDSPLKKGQKRKSEETSTTEEPAKVPKLCEMKKKDRKTLRRQQESKVFDIATKSKKIWEDMRREDCSDEKRQLLCKKLMTLVQGHVKELIFAHDTVRVIECLLAHGNKEQRSVLFEELKDSMVLLSKSKYAKFFVLKALKYGSKAERNEIIQSFVGKVAKCINHSEASSVLEEAYNEYANAAQRSSLVQEFYGPTFAVFKEEGVNGLQCVLEKQPAQKDSILAYLKNLLTKFTEKTVVKHSIIHNVLKDYLTYADDKGRAEVIEAWRESLGHIVHTRDGSRAAMMCLWHGTPKDRKVILKSFKTLISKIAMEEHGSLVLMSLFDCVDDTKFVEKVIINELLQDMLKLVNDNHSRKVLIYLICPRDPHYFHPDIVNILSKGDGNSSSKKESKIRSSELALAVGEFYVKFVSENIESLIKNNATCLFVLTVLQKIPGDRTDGLKAIAKYLLSEPYYSRRDNEFHPIEHRGSNMLLKKLIKDDIQHKDSSDKIFFSDILVSLATSGSLKSWIECNRGAFALLDLLETGLPTVVDFVLKEMNGLNKKLSNLKYKGAELLLKKVRDENVKGEK